MKTAILIPLFMTVAGLAAAANVPTGITGLWRFQSDTDKLKATLGVDLTTSNPENSAWFTGPWTVIEPGLSDGGVVQERSWDYLTVNPSFTANGGGTYVNEYTVAIDYVQTSGLTNWNSLFQTADGGNQNDGDLWTDGSGHIGVGDVGYSTLTYDASKWHRIVWSVSNGNFFRVYVDGDLFLDGPGQPVDGRFALYVDKFHLFADDSWEDEWGLVGLVATWNRALSSAEVAAMGGWIADAAEPTPLNFSPTNPAPIIASVSPADGDTNLSPHFAYQATILDGSTARVNTSTLQLLLDGIPVTPVLTSALDILTVKFSAGGFIRSGSTHQYTLSFEDDAATPASYSNTVSFTVQSYTSYEWNFAQGDLGTALGNGVMDYADQTSTPGLTSFGTTDGATVPHIGGLPAKYMHVPAFTLDTDGYYLSFNDSPPNVNGYQYLNRYSAFFDILIPSPVAPTDWLPFFNTDPFNLNDADFYFSGEDGSIGIGAGYSPAGTIAADTWYRIIFVADLPANTLTYYVNGSRVKSRPADGLEGRWALYSNQDAGPDLLLFNEGDTSGVYTHELYLSSVAFTDRPISDDEAADLGGPNAEGILLPSFAPRPTLSIQASGPTATLSWPSNYVGYALEQSAALTAPQWKPVPGITNNAVQLSPSNSATFFRLVQ